MNSNVLINPSHSMILGSPGKLLNSFLGRVADGDSHSVCGTKRSAGKLFPKIYWSFSYCLVSVLFLCAGGRCETRWA